MLGHLYEGQDCSAARALELVGERWSLLILRDALFRDCTRFSDFERRLGIAPNSLVKRLETFVAAGIMDVVARGPRNDQREYVLTRKGADFKAVIMALTAWGDRWVGPGPVEFVHPECTGPIELRAVCTDGDTHVDIAGARVRLRP